MSKDKSSIEYPKVSVIIPTYTSSEKYIEMCIKAVLAQKYPREKIEIIVADNYSKDKTRNIAESLGAKVYLRPGKPSQACAQRNLGAKHAKGEYLLFLDHDMEMAPKLLKNFAKHIKVTGGKVDAWFVPEKIISSSKFMSRIRNFERSFYNATVIDAARIIKKDAFWRTRDRYDQKLSNGPADWDMDLQLREIGAEFGIIQEPVYHHEELLSFRKYIGKKGIYVSGGNYYHKKWRRSQELYPIILKQHSISYRLFGVFFESGKWKKTISRIDLYLLILCVRILIGLVYLNAKRKAHEQ